MITYNILLFAKITHQFLAMCLVGGAIFLFIAAFRIVLP